MKVTLGEIISLWFGEDTQKSREFLNTPKGSAIWRACQDVSDKPFFAPSGNTPGNYTWADKRAFAREVKATLKREAEAEDSPSVEMTTLEVPTSIAVSKKTGQIYPVNGDKIGPYAITVDLSGFRKTGDNNLFTIYTRRQRQ